MQKRLAARGRAPDSLKVFQGTSVIVAASAADAEAQYQDTARLVTIDNALDYLGRYFDHHDFTQYALEAATPRPAFAGTPEQVADGLQAWVDARATDGFIVRGGTPTAFTEFATKVVPILQERGVYRRDYEGATLREHLGLAYPVNRHARAA